MVVSAIAMLPQINAKYDSTNVATHNVSNHTTHGKTTHQKYVLIIDI